MKFPRLIVLLIGLLSFSLFAADVVPGQRLAFETCPIIQDTDSVPCWVAQYDGELYYIGIQTDSSAPYNPPYLGHRALFEGIVADKPRICGGIVLEPVNVSVIPELDPSCREMRPASDRYKVDFNPRGPGPSTGKLAFRPRPSVTDGLSAPYPSKTFTLYYDINTGVRGRHYQIMNNVLAYSEAINASRVVLKGYTGETLLSSGERLSERLDIGKIRASQMANLLEEVGLKSPVVIDTATSLRGKGDKDWQTRRLDITIYP